MVAIAPKLTLPMSPWAPFRLSGELSDLIVRIGGKELRLHRFPFFTRSPKLKEKLHHLKDEAVLELDELPGGLQAFHAIADYCYGVSSAIPKTSVTHTLLGALHLEMTDDFSPDNLINACVGYLKAEVYTNWKACLEILNDAVVRKYAHTLGSDIVSACQTTISVYAESIDHLPDPLERVSETWNFFRHVAALPLEQLKALLTVFEEHNVTFIRTGNSLASAGKKWMFEPLIQEDGSTMVSDTGLSPTEGAMKLQVILTYLVKMLDWPLTNIKCEPCESAHGRSEQMKLTIPPSPSYLVTLMRHSEALGSKLASDIQRRIGKVLPQVGFEEVKSLHPESVCTIFALYAKELPIDGTAASGNLIAAGKLADAYILKAAEDKKLTLANLHALCEVLPKNARKNCDILYIVIDMFLVNNTDVSEDDRVKLCDHLAGENLESLKLSQEMVKHALLGGRLPAKPRFISAMLAFHEKALMAEKKKVEDQAKTIESLHGSVKRMHEELEITRASLQMEKNTTNCLMAEVEKHSKRVKLSVSGEEGTPRSVLPQR